MGGLLFFTTLLKNILTDLISVRSHEIVKV